MIFMYKTRCLCGIRQFRDGVVFDREVSMCNLPDLALLTARRALQERPDSAARKRKLK